MKAIKKLLNQIKKNWKKYVLIDVALAMTTEEIKEKYRTQRENKDWTLFSERNFIEQLFCTRFNYFIASLSLLIAATARIESSVSLCIMLLISSIILTLMRLAIYRIYVKLIVILRLIYQLDDYQVFKMIDYEVKSMNNKISVPVNAIIGVIIPFIGTISFWIYTIISFVNLL